MPERVQPLIQDLSASPDLTAEVPTLPGARGRSTEELLRRILQTLPGGIAQVDTDGSIIYANDEAMRLLKLTFDDPSKHSLRDFEERTLWEDGAPCPVDQYPASQCLRTGKPAPPATVGIRLQDGSIFWGVFSAIPLLDDKTGAVTGTVVSILDITQRKDAEELLQQSEDRYRRLVDHAPDAIVVHRDGQLVFVNRAAVKLWGAQSRSDLIGRRILDLVHPENRERAAMRIHQIVTEKVATPLAKARLLRLDGSVVHAEVTGTPCTFEGAECVQAIFRDTTERTHAEEQFRRQTELMETIFQRAPVMLCLADPSGQVVLANPEWSNLFGDISRERKIGEIIDVCFPDPAERANVSAYIASAPAGWVDFRTRLPDGRMLDLSWANVKLSDGTTIGIGQDITERKQVEEALRHTKAELELRVAARTEELSRKNDELEKEIAEHRRTEQQLQEKQKFLRQMLNAHERDRQLVAYEIHDTFVQDVIGALMLFDAFQARKCTDDDPDWEEFARARKLLRAAIDEARRMISGLRPPIIDEQGIVAAIEYLISELKSRGRDIEFRHALHVARLPPLLEATIFRIVQEALNNLERHSGSDYGQVELTQEPLSVRVVVSDFGLGFDPDAVSEGHFGLQGIRERTRLLGGTVTIRSAPGKGTDVIVELPFVEDE